MDELKVKDVIGTLEAIAPLELALDYDNVGLLVGSELQTVTGIILGLELTHNLIDEAVQKGCSLIIVHHPLFLKPVKRIVSEDVVGAKVIRLIEQHLSLYVAHTNLDLAPLGLNNYVAKKLGLQMMTITNKDADLPTNIHIGRVEETTLIQYAAKVKHQLELDYLHYCGEEEKAVNIAALCTGSGMSYYQEAIDAGADVYITGDVKYHDYVMALDLGVPVIDASHYGTEIWVIDVFYNHLKELVATSNPLLPLIKHTNYHNPIKLV